MRLIDADTLWETIKLMDESDDLDVEAMAIAIQYAPTVDARPVKHGYWIEHPEFDSGHKNCNVCIECSECHAWFGHDCYAKTNFCPNCGADMREKGIPIEYFESGGV